MFFLCPWPTEFDIALLWTSFFVCCSSDGLLAQDDAIQTFVHGFWSESKNVHLSNTTILRDDDASSQKGQDSIYSPDLHTLSDRSMLWTKVKVILHIYLPSSSFLSLISFFTQANKAHPDMNHAALLYQHYSTSIYRATAFFEHWKESRVCWKNHLIGLVKSCL